MDFWCCISEHSGFMSDQEMPSLLATMKEVRPIESHIRIAH